jgi:hypothetical protein
VRVSSCFIAISFAISAILLASCGGQQPKSGPANSDDSKLISEIFGSASPLELKILSSPPVTLSSYVQVIGASIRCLREGGFKVSNPALATYGLFAFTTSYSWGHKKDLKFHPSAAKEKATASRLQTCTNLSSAVEATYIYEHHSSDIDVSQRFHAMIRCFQRLGLSFPRSEPLSSSYQALIEAREAIAARSVALSAVSSCEKYLEATSLTPLPGIKKALTALNVK